MVSKGYIKHRRSIAQKARETPEKAIREKVHKIKSQRVGVHVYSIINAMEDAIQKYAYEYVRQGEVPEDFDAEAIDILYEAGIVKFNLSEFVHKQYKAQRE